MNIKKNGILMFNTNLKKLENKHTHTQTAIKISDLHQSVMYQQNKSEVN